jgi:hypothetical protein
MGLGLGVHGLAWAAVIVSAIEVSILFYVMSKRIKGMFDKVFVNAVIRMASAAGFMTIVTYLSVILLPFEADDQSFYLAFPKFVLIVLISGIAYLVFSRLFKIHEATPVIRRLRSVYDRIKTTIQKILFKSPGNF